MPLFEYVVKDENGRDVSGVQEAENVQALVTAFRSKRYTIVKVNIVLPGKCCWSISNPKPTNLPNALPT